MNWSEGVRSFDALFTGLSRVFADALAEATEFICVGGIPGFFVVGMASELAMNSSSTGSAM